MQSLILNRNHLQSMIDHLDLPVLLGPADCWQARGFWVEADDFREVSLLIE